MNWSAPSTVAQGTQEKKIDSLTDKTTKGTYYIHIFIYIIVATESWSGTCKKIKSGAPYGGCRMKGWKWAYLACGEIPHFKTLLFKWPPILDQWIYIMTWSQLPVTLYFLNFDVWYQLFWNLTPFKTDSILKTELTVSCPKRQIHFSQLFPNQCRLDSERW